MTLAVACPAFAADPSSQSVKERVVYRDLDLSTRQGAQVLVRRVRAAAQSLCAPTAPRIFGAISQDERQCQEAAIARAISALGSPLVTAEYNGRNVRVALKAPRS